MSPQGNTLLYVDLKGNARVLWQQQGGWGRIWGAPSPDGRYLAIGAEVNNSNVWCWKASERGFGGAAGCCGLSFREPARGPHVDLPMLHC
jgi:hypothetical protein